MLLVHILIALISFFPNRIAKESYLVVKGERITVQAATSMGGINCTYKSERPGDTLYLNRQMAKGERLVLNLPVKSFGCGNMLLTRDFQRTLNASDYPLVRVEVLELVEEGLRMVGTVRMQLAGKTQVLRNVSFCKKPGQKLVADICLKFSDFDLTTPNKLGGLVKVEEELQVTVELLLAQRSPSQTGVTGQKINL